LCLLSPGLEDLDYDDYNYDDDYYDYYDYYDYDYDDDDDDDDYYYYDDYYYFYYYCIFFHQGQLCLLCNIKLGEKRAVGRCWTQSERRDSGKKCAQAPWQ
jgi:hypothetical protein